MTEDVFGGLLAEFTRTGSGAHVLNDYLLQVGVPEAVAKDFLHGLALHRNEDVTNEGSTRASRAVGEILGRNPVLIDTLRPFVYYDTVDLVPGRVTPFRGFTFTGGIQKTLAETNMTQPLRLPSYCSLSLRRVSVTLVTTGFDLSRSVLRLDVNRRPIIEAPLQQFLSPFGVMTIEQWNDRDDILCSIDTHGEPQGPYPRVRVNLHGWLKEPLGR